MSKRIDDGYHFDLLALHCLTVFRLKKKYGLTRNEITLLSAIYVHLDTTNRQWIYPQELQNALVPWLRSYLHRRLKSLRDRGFLKSQPGTGRKQLYNLTDKGHKVLKDFNKELLKIISEYYETYKK